MTELPTKQWFIENCDEGHFVAEDKSGGLYQFAFNDFKISPVVGESFHADGFGVLEILAVNGAANE